MKKTFLFTILIFSFVAAGCMNQKSEVKNQISENKNQSNQLQITPTSTIENIQGTKDRRSYKNKKYKFSIKYPVKFNINNNISNENKISFDAEGPGCALDIEIFNQTVNSKVDEWKNNKWNYDGQKSFNSKKWHIFSNKKGNEMIGGKWYIGLFQLDEKSVIQIMLNRCGTREQFNKILLSFEFLDEIDNIKDWRVYEKKDQNVRIKYHKNWYYDRDEQAEKDLGHDLYIGFAESPEILAQGAPYPIEFMISSKDEQVSEWEEKYSKIISTATKVNYILATPNKSKYKNILDKMAESFEFLDK